MDKESVKLALRQHYPAGYRYLGCPVISSRVRPTVLLAARAPQRKLIALRATVPSSGTGPSTRSCPTAASPVLTRGYSPCDPIRGIPLSRYHLSPFSRSSTAYSEGPADPSFPLPLFFRRLSPLHAPTHTPHTHTHIYTHKRVYTRIRSDVANRARARANDPFSSSLLLRSSLKASLSLSLSLERGVLLRYLSYPTYHHSLAHSLAFSFNPPSLLSLLGVPTSLPRSNAAGTKGRSLVNARPRPSLTRGFLSSTLSANSPLFYFRVLSTFSLGVFLLSWQCVFRVPRKGLCPRYRLSW